MGWGEGGRENKKIKIEKYLRGGWGVGGLRGSLVDQLVARVLFHLDPLVWANLVVVVMTMMRMMLYWLRPTS